MTRETSSGPPPEAKFLADLNEFVPGSAPLETSLQTDDQVIARVTDGIYRQPGSALRELISNAYDADASQVTIKTDRPRFERIYVEDDGNGMSTETLVRLLYHIGGSAKRKSEGRELGIAHPSDPSKSLHGRPLIGKIGIGLFSVAQLTHGFQVITKQAGDKHRTVARVVMRQYSESAEFTDDGKRVYEAGKARVWIEPASDLDSHGTTIVLDAIRRQTRDTLQSRGRWDAVFGNAEALTAGSEQTNAKPPRFHIGTVSPQDAHYFRGEVGQARLPWLQSDSPERAFSKLVASIWDAIDEGIPNPRLDQLFDYYLRMIWQLSIWAPLSYIDKHPFDLDESDGFEVFDLNNDDDEPVGLGSGMKVRDVTSVKLAPAPTETDGFKVLVDDLELHRPVRTQSLPRTSSALDRPLLFVGTARYEFAGVDQELSGGPLAFSAYIMWAPKIAPTEHQGVVVRVHDATGTFPYDEKFLNFPVAESRRMAHLSCEIFVSEGFDESLNIDRESFNFANPHVVVTTKWLHRALRRVIATEKRLAATARAERRQAGALAARSEADVVVSDLWYEQHADDGSEPPQVDFRTRPNEPTRPGSHILDAKYVLGDFVGANATARRRAAESELAHLLQVIASFGLVDELSPDEVQRLAKALREIVQAYHA